MTKKNLTFFGLLALFAASCSNDEMSEIPTIKQDAIVVTAGLNANTRVSFSQGDNVTHAFWEKNDQITLYAASQGGLDYQVNTINEDGNTATFAPVGDALLNTAEAIYATYPATVIKEGLVILQATDVWTDEKPLPFAYATSQVADGNVNLSFDHLFAYLKLTLNAETTTGEVTSLWMKTSSSEPLAIKEGTYDIANDKLSLVKSSNSIYFKLQEPFIAADATEKYLYIPILPQPAGETITLSILHEHEAGCDTLLTILKETPSSGFLAGHAYTYSPKAPFIVEGNTITLSTAGTLFQAISAEAKDTITTLRIIGPLNGDDIRFIREMAGRSADDLETEGKLTDLDISEAMIVGGGGAYYNYNPDYPCYSENNKIGSYMFRATTLKLILLPNNITSIDDYAFSACHSLTHVVIPNSVTSIGEAAFISCSSLTSVIVGNSVTSIGEYAFRFCSSLTSVTIPDSVVSIGSFAFDGCSDLMNAFIGNGVKEIGSWSFGDCISLKNVVIPDAVTSIGYSAFCGCTSLVSAIIGNGLTSTGERVFRECSSLVSVTIGSGVTSIDEAAFSFCTSLDNITIPNNVTSIGDYAFYGSSSLAKVTSHATIPPTLGYRAFDDIHSSATLYTPIGTYTTYMNSEWGQYFTSVSEFHAGYANGIVIIETAGTLSSLISEDEKYTITKLKVIGPLNGNDIRFIREMAGRDISGNETQGDLIDLDISEAAIVEGGDYYYSPIYQYCTENDKVGAWMFCFTQLEKIILPNSLNSIDVYAFSGCESLNSVTIFTGVVSIGRMAFENCVSLVNITIPDEITFIGDHAFWYCQSLRKIILPNNLTIVEEGIFSDCCSLTDITIPDSVTSISDSAFERCYGLTSITLSSSLVSIGNYVFRGSNIAKVVCEAVMPPILGTKVFENIPSSAKLFVPTGCVTAYSESDWVSYFSTIEEKEM